MLAQDTINAVRIQINETNPADSHFTDSELLTFINDCTIDIISKISAYPKVNYTVAVTDTLTLDSDVVVVDKIYLLHGGKYEQLQTVDFDTFTNSNSSWLNEPSGKPSTAIRMDAFTWKLFPTPSAEYLTDTVLIYARSIPAALTSANEELPFVKTIHTAYEHYIASKCWPKLNDVPKSQAEYAMYSNILKVQTPVITATIGSQKYFTFGL